MLLAKASELEQVLLASFDIDELRAFRNLESWRMEYRLHGRCR